MTVMVPSHICPNQNQEGEEADNIQKTVLFTDEIHKLVSDFVPKDEDEIIFIHLKVFKRNFNNEDLKDE